MEKKKKPATIQRPIRFFFFFFFFFFIINCLAFWMANPSKRTDYPSSKCMFKMDRKSIHFIKRMKNPSIEEDGKPIPMRFFFFFFFLFFFWLVRMKTLNQQRITDTTCPVIFNLYNWSYTGVILNIYKFY